jgi:hypothetical protein
MNLHRTTNDLASPGSFLRVVVLGVLAVASGAAQSNTDTNAGGNASVETLRKRIDELEAGQKQMQETIDTLKGAAPPAASTPGPQAVADTATADASGADSFDHSHALGPVQFEGFSDFDYGRNWFENLPPTGLGGSPQSFSVGDFDLLTNTRIAEHWSMLGEVLVTSDFTNAFSVEIDRLLLTYRKNEYFKISVGKFNTALGYYTNAFHRAQYFQTVVGKPIMYSDEDSNGILPVHNIGITATGQIPSGSLGLHWVAEVANGRSITPDSEAVQNFVDQNNGKAVNFAAYIRPDWLSGFQTGFSFYRDTQHPFGIADAVGETIFTVHAAYVGRKLEWLNEGALLRHALQGETITSPAVQLLTRKCPGRWASFGRMRATTMKTSPRAIPSSGCWEERLTDNPAGSEALLSE